MNHFNISLIKSILRIVGCIGGVIYAATNLFTIGLLFISILFGTAEVLGILEEIFDKRKED